MFVYSCANAGGLFHKQWPSVWKVCLLWLWKSWEVAPDWLDSTSIYFFKILHFSSRLTTAYKWLLKYYRFKPCKTPKYLPNLGVIRLPYSGQAAILLLSSRLAQNEAHYSHQVLRARTINQCGHSEWLRKKRTNELSGHRNLPLGMFTHTLNKICNIHVLSKWSITWDYLSKEGNWGRRGFVQAAEGGMQWVWSVKNIYKTRF